MEEILLPKWVEVVIGFIIMSGLLATIIVSTWYQKEKQVDDYEDLKKMMPKLPKEKK
jgi:hypothetical protein